MRKIKFAPHEYYHLCGRGTDGNKLFLEEADFARFLFLILHFQSPTVFNNPSFYISKFLKTGSFGLPAEKLEKHLKHRGLELVAFSLMDNHYHLLIGNFEDGAISIYMQRVLMAYSKYFNSKYKRKGHLFQGPFTAVHIENNTQLLHTSAYVHKNPKDLTLWKEFYTDYPYSSLKDYLEVSRWGTLLSQKIILEQFKNPLAYRHFIETSTAKEYETGMDVDIILGDQAKESAIEPDSHFL